MNVWRENPSRRRFEGLAADFDLEKDDSGITIAALSKTGDVLYSAPLDGRGGSRTGSAPDLGAARSLSSRASTIAHHPATWIAGAALVGLLLRRARG